MERPIATAVRVERSGTMAVAVTVSLLRDNKYAVTISDPWNGSGIAIGDWPNGFIAGEVPTSSEVDYVVKKFGMCVVDQIPKTDFIDWNTMYMGALSEVKKEAFTCRQKKI
jgi:hypothetical protein